MKNKKMKNEDELVLAELGDELIKEKLTLQKELLTLEKRVRKLEKSIEGHRAKGRVAIAGDALLKFFTQKRIYEVVEKLDKINEKMKNDK